METNGESKVRKILFNEVSLIFGIVAVFLSGFIYITSPNNDNNVALKLQEERINGQRKTIDDITRTQQNDTQEVKTELVRMNTEIQNICISIKELSTIIDERIPKK